MVVTKNFHWHVSGPHFRDDHLMLDEQGAQILATTDSIAERVRKIGGTTIRSIGHISRLQRVLDNDADYVTPLDMLAELRDDNIQLIGRLRETHELCDENRDVATASLIEPWIDEAEGRVWFLFESSRRPTSSDASGECAMPSLLKLTAFRGILGFLQVMGIVVFASSAQRWSQSLAALVPGATCVEEVRRYEMSEYWKELVLGKLPTYLPSSCRSRARRSYAVPGVDKPFEGPGGDPFKGS
jgi:starvation-inducible DNA-binding protein